MISLLELQRAFARAIVSGDDVDVAKLVVGDAFSGAERVNVYRNNHLESLSAAMGDVYPVVARLVGDGFFRRSVACYLREYPLHQGSLVDFGGAFGTFLSRFQPAAGLAYLGDVARLEWAWHEVFHAAGSDPIDARALAGLAGEDADRLRFRLSPASRLLGSPYPVLRIWEVNQPEHEEVEAVSLDEGPDDLLVLRLGLQVEIIRLEAPERLFLDMLGAGAELGRTCEEVCMSHGSFDPVGALSRHARMGTIVGVVRPSDLGE